MTDGDGFTEAKREEYLGHLAAGMMRGAAAYVIGLQRSIVDGYISEHPDYALAVAEAEETATEHVQEAIYHAAVSGSVPAAKLWLTIRGVIRRPRSPRPGGGAAPDPHGPPSESEVGALLDELDG